MSRDLSDPGPEEDITAEEVQAAQRIVGELMWLVTRCRADLAYTVAKMASQVARTPRWVVQVGKQALKRLNGTKEEGLLFSVDAGTDLNGRGEPVWRWRRMQALHQAEALAMAV